MQFLSSRPSLAPNRPSPSPQPGRRVPGSALAVGFTTVLAVVLTLVLGVAPAPAAHAAGEVGQGEGGHVEVDGMTFDSWEAFARSEIFRAQGRRCGTPEPASRLIFDPPVRGFEGTVAGKAPADCSATATNPTADYSGPVVYSIPVVVHVIQATDGTGALSNAQVQSQIDILNEDFRALTGTPGAVGTDVQIVFELAGITRSTDNTWFNDGGSYWNTLAWDPNLYLNIYTNNASGNLGYVPFLPADAGGAFVGTSSDRVVVLHSAFGRNAPAFPYDQGRTTTHEVGHYLGLEHTFNPQNSCGSTAAPGCYGDGDLLCDTPPERSPRFGCPTNPTSCSTPDPYTNYMDYTDDRCMEEFTVEQARRMRCTLEHWRPNLATVTTAEIFTDGFESGNVSAWSSSVP